MVLNKKENDMEYKDCSRGDKCVNPLGYKDLPISEFNKDKHQKTGLTSQCKLCVKRPSADKKHKRTDAPQGFKWCSNYDECINPNGSLLPVDEFSKHKKGEGGLRSECKVCCNKYNNDNKERTNKWREGRIDKEKEYYQIHKIEKGEYNKEWRKNHVNERRKYKIDNSEYYKNQEKQRAIKLKTDVFSHYGGLICVQCSCDIFDLLTIDHINNDGAEHKRKEGINGGSSLYRWLRDNNYPDGFQVMCFNCNCGKQSNSKNKRQTTLKINCFNAYGGCVCKYCNETRLECLTLDHVFNDGGKERKKFPSRHVYKYLKDQNYPNPSRYQVLCWNCNWSKRLGLIE